MQVTRTFTDIDEHAAQMPGFDQHYVQLSPGRFHGVFSNLRLSQGIGFDVEWVEQALHQQACVPAATVSLVTFVDLDGQAIFNGRTMGPLDSLVLPAGTSFDLRTPQHTHISVISIPEPLLRREMAAWLGPDEPAWTLRSSLLLDRAALSSALRPVLDDLLGALQASPRAGAEGAIAASAGDRLLQATLCLLESRHRADSGAVAADAAVARRDVFLTVSEAINSLDAGDMSIGMLCRLAAVSRRTLEYAFADAVGMSPLQYLKLKRLNNVRRDLAAATAGVTVGDVAARHGIWHLGRLSKEYRQLFGELPSVTLHGRSGLVSPRR